MRKRHLKKMITHHSKPEQGAAYRAAFSRGSRKLSRRARSLLRLQRQHSKQSLARYESSKALLPELASYVPQNTEEEQGLEEMTRRAREIIQNYETEQESKQRMADVRRSIKNASNMFGAVWSHVNAAVGDADKAVNSFTDSLAPMIEE